MANAKRLFQEPTIAVITGASQGLGRGIAVELAAELAEGSLIVLSARSKDGLEETARVAKLERRNSNGVGEVEIRTVTSDLSKSEDIRNTMKSCLKDCIPSKFSSAILILNFGTLGDVSKEMCDFRDPDYVADYFRVNLAHIPILTGEVIDWTRAGETKLDTFVVNISSLAAVQPLICMSLYSSGKAARDMMLKVLATENNNVRVLNYAPGPLLGTNMTKTLMSTSNRHNTADNFCEMEANGKYLTCKQSASKLLRLLRMDSYSNGDHVDYYDVVDDS